MSDELLDRLLTEFESFELPFYFAPFKLSDPFLDKRMIPLCERFNRQVPKGHLRLFTNGSALTDKTISGVAGLKRVAHLWISLNEHDPEKYEQVMGLNFAHTTKNLDHLHQEVVLGRFSHPVVVSRVGGSVGERWSFADYVRNRWPRFQPSVIRKDAWIDFTNSDELTVPEHQCGRWWELNITATGEVCLCCMSDGESPDQIVGDVNTQTMKEIYNSARWREFRDTTNRKDRPICSTCSYG